MHIVYCSRTHKFHFSATFSLKMGPTVLFTHFKIILLQYFSVFSFSFQFSTISKRTLTKTKRPTKLNSIFLNSKFFIPLFVCSTLFFTSYVMLCYVMFFFFFFPNYNYLIRKVNHIYITSCDFWSTD